MKKYLIIVAALLFVGAGCSQLEAVTETEYRLPPGSPYAFTCMGSVEFCRKELDTHEVTAKEYIDFHKDKQQKEIDTLKSQLAEFMEAEGYVEFTEPAKPEVPEKTYITKDPKKKEWTSLNCEIELAPKKRWGPSPLFVGEIEDPEPQSKEFQRCKELKKELGLLLTTSTTASTYSNAYTVVGDTVKFKLPESVVEEWEKKVNEVFETWEKELGL